MLVESTLPTLPTSGAILHDCAYLVLRHGSYLGPHCVVASLPLLLGTEDLSAKRPKYFQKQSMHKFCAEAWSLRDFGGKGLAACQLAGGGLPRGPA